MDVHGVRIWISLVSGRRPHDFGWCGPLIRGSQDGSAIQLAAALPALPDQPLEAAVLLQRSQDVRSWPFPYPWPSQAYNYPGSSQEFVGFIQTDDMHLIHSTVIHLHFCAW
jgi:hypothetical protein